jgi:hypothetical protein
MIRRMSELHPLFCGKYGFQPTLIDYPDFVCSFLHRRSQVRAGVHCWFGIYPCRADRSTSPRCPGPWARPPAPGIYECDDASAGRGCLTLWFFNKHVSVRMLVRGPVHGMQGPLEKHGSYPTTRTSPKRRCSCHLCMLYLEKKYLFLH